MDQRWLDIIKVKVELEEFNSLFGKIKNKYDLRVLRIENVSCILNIAQNPTISQNLRRFDSVKIEHSIFEFTAVGSEKVTP